jgi:peptidoglycan/LPS O-acetylase OafA/YrhL
MLEPVAPQQRARNLFLRLVVAVVLPAVAVEVAFPVLHAFTTVYNEPENPLSSFVLSLLLTAVPGIMLAVLVRTRWLFATGVVLGVASAIVVAVQVATTDDGQAGLAVLGLPIYMGVAGVVVLAIDRSRAFTQTK